MIILSKKGIPAKYNITANTANIRRYNKYKICAVFLSFETTLPNTGPGTSALITSKWLFLEFSMMARANTKTPIPPIRWVKLRQNKSAGDKTLTSSRIVAPVVVKPEDTSKKASIILGICPEITNGRAPKKDQSIQQSATINMPSLV